MPETRPHRAFPRIRSDHITSLMRLLRSIPTISLNAPLDAANPLTTQVTLSDNGVLALKDVDVASFIVQANYRDGGTQKGNIGLGYVPPNQTLDPGDGETFSIESLLTYFEAPATYADVALIVSFKPQFMPFWQRRKVFRFKTVKQADGTLIFQQQPPGDVLEQYQRVWNRLVGPSH